MKINIDMLNEAIVSTKGTGTKKTYSLNYVNAIDDRVTTNSSNISSILSDNIELHKYTNWLVSMELTTDEQLLLFPHDKVLNFQQWWLLVIGIMESIILMLIQLPKPVEKNLQHHKLY